MLLLCLAYKQCYSLFILKHTPRLADSIYGFYFGMSRFRDCELNPFTSAVFIYWRRPLFESTVI